MEDLKKTLLEADAQKAALKFDEFSVSEKPSTYYALAEKNTSPKIVTNEKKGFKQVDIFLDRNTIHKTKMQNLFKDLAKDLKIQTNFHLMMSYSPKLNLVEYVIHLIRQKILQHADHKLNLEDFENKIKGCCKKQDIISKEQIINILVHIKILVPKL